MKHMNLQLFWDAHVDPGTLEINPVNLTTTASMGPTMKTFYEKSLLENSREAMVFSQLGKKVPMHGNSIEWRKFNTFPKALTPLSEGVIPTGQNFGMTSITATTTQHGDYVSIADRLELEAFDDTIYGATEEMGAAQGETYDTLTRNIITAGTNVMFAPILSGSTETAVDERIEITPAAVLTPKLVAQIATKLKKDKAPRFAGNTYAMVIHPSQAFDLRNTDEWKEFHKYADVAPIFNGEIGTLHGIRFIESNNVRIFKGANLTEDSRNLTVKTAVSASTTVAVTEAISDDEATALAGRVIIDASGNEYEIASASAAAAGSASLTLKEAATIAKDAVLYPSEGGAEGTAVYGALAMGRDAFGVLDPEGEGMELIIKSRDEIGGPLNQFSTVGYKFCHGAQILYPERLVRVETGSSYGDVDEAN